METMDLFKGILIMSLFYGFSITLLAYYIPDENITHIQMFNGLNDRIDLNSVSSEVETSLQKQTNLPLIELGALVFYSGNILIDLLLNFILALPLMCVMLINGIIYLLPSFPAQMKNNILLFSTSLFTIMYLIGIIQLLTNIRATGKVI